MPQPQQISPSTAPKATVSVAKICSVILIFLAMLTAASVPLQVSWLWLLLPLIFLAYIDVSSSGPSLTAALVAPQTWLFYGGLVAVALAFQFGGLEQAKPVSRPAIAANSITQPNFPSYPRTSSGPRPSGPGWPNTPSVAPGSSLPRPASPPMSVRQTTVPGSAPMKSSPMTPTPSAMPTASARPAPTQSLAQPVTPPAESSSITPPEPKPTTITAPAPGKAALPTVPPPTSPPSTPPK